MLIRRHVRLSIILIALVFYPGLNWADSWQQDGSVGITTEYTTNPTFVPASQTGVWQYVFAPSYTLRRASEVNELKAGIAFQVLRSSNLFLIQNRNNPSAFLDWNRSSDVGKFGVSAKYDEVSTLLSEVDISGPRLADATQASRIFSGSWNKALSERSTLSADGTYQDVSYSSGTYTNYDTRTGNMTYTHDWTERIKPYIEISYADYEPANVNSTFPPSHFTDTALGLNWEATENLTGTLQAGKANVSGAGMIGTQGLTLQYAGQRTGLTLNESRQLLATGLGGIVAVDQAKANWSYTLNEINKIGIDLVRQKNHYADEAINSSAGAWLQHDINSFWGVRTYYLHRTNFQVGLGGAYSDTLGIVLSYSRPDF